MLPALDIIDGFKGKLDFYIHDGIPCVRSWPRSPGKKRAPAVEAQWPIFAWAAAHWKSLTPYVREAYITTAEGMTMTGRDLFVKAFIEDYFREGQWDNV